jgi:chromate transporter
VLLGGHELLVLAVGGLAAILLAGRRRPPAAVSEPPAPVSVGLAHLLPVAVVAAPFSLSGLFLFFLKVGSVLFGSGYVLLAFLRADLVERWGWLTESQLLDAVAIGQMTPGPVFTTATFIGYLLAGPPGAAVATVGIFLPAFVFVALSGPLIPRIRRSKTAGAFLDGVNATALALMAVVSLQLARAAIVDGLTAGLAVVSLGLLVLFRIPSPWLLAGGAVIGLLSTFRP